MRTKLSRSKNKLNLFPKINLKDLDIKKINIKRIISKSISAKVFVITSLVLILFLTALYFTISLGFENYYKTKKATSFGTLVLKFCSDFSKIEGDNVSSIDAKRIEFIKYFQSIYNVKVEIFDMNMHLKYDGPIKYTGTENIDDIQKSNTASYEAKVASYIYMEVGEPTSVDGSGYSGSAEGLDIWPYDAGKVLYGFSKDYASDDSGVHFSKYYAFLLSSMYPINDAVSSIQTFFVYYYIASIFIVFIVSLIFSNAITKPLKAINNVAVKMSSFDFSEKCSDKYKDEIGSLAKSLNLLSSNLQRSIKKLKETNKKLEDDIERERNLEKIRKEFVAAVSHDLKTPVSIIQGYAESIKDGIFEGEEANNCLDIIIDETDKMNSLIKDMLDLSALEGGNIIINRQRYNFSDQLKKVLRNLASMAKEKGMRFAINPFKDEFINADYNRIEQVLNNLITNAIKYGYENTNIKILLIENEEGYISVEFENEGDIILKEDFEKIWTRFYKIDKSRNRNAGGTGLGLAISKNIIQLHNGEIGGYNKKNTIVFYFKLKKD